MTEQRCAFNNCTPICTQLVTARSLFERVAIKHLHLYSHNFNTGCFVDLHIFSSAHTSLIHVVLNITKIYAILITRFYHRRVQEISAHKICDKFDVHIKDSHKLLYTISSYTGKYLYNSVSHIDSFLQLIRTHAIYYSTHV